MFARGAALRGFLSPRSLRRQPKCCGMHWGSVPVPVRAGGDIESVPLHRQFAAQTKLSWNALDSDARACARRLSVLSEPLPSRECSELCGMSLPQYADAVDRLRRGFILATVVNGEPW